MSFGSVLQKQSTLHHPAQLLPAFQPSYESQPQRPAPLSTNINPNSSSHVFHQADSPRTPVQRSFSDPNRVMTVGMGGWGVGSSGGAVANNNTPGGQVAQPFLYPSPLPSRPTPAETLLRRKTPGGGMVIGGFDAAPPINFPGGSGFVQLDGAEDAGVGRPRKHILLVNSGIAGSGMGNFSNQAGYQQSLNNGMNDASEPSTPTNSSMQNSFGPTYGKENMMPYQNIGQQLQGFQTPGPMPQITDLSRIPAASGNAQLQINTNPGAFQHEPLDDSAFPNRSNNATPVPLDFQRRQAMTPSFPNFPPNGIPLPQNLHQYPHVQQLQNNMTLSYPQLGALVQDGGPMPAVLGFNSPAHAWSPAVTPGLGMEGSGMVFPQYTPPSYVPQTPGFMPHQSSTQISQHLPQQTALASGVSSSGNPFQKPLSPKSMEKQREISKDVLLMYCNDAYVDLLSMKQQHGAFYGKGRFLQLPRHVGLTTKTVMSGVWRNGARLRPELQRHFSDPTIAVTTRSREAYAMPSGRAAGGNSVRQFDSGMHGEPESVSSASKRRRLNSLQDDGRIAQHLANAGTPPPVGLQMRSASTTNLAAMGARPGISGGQPLGDIPPMPNRRFGQQHRASSMTSLVEMRKRQHPDVRVLRATDPPVYQASFDQQAAFQMQSPTGTSMNMQRAAIPAPIQVANSALALLEKDCAEDNWSWLEGMLLAGCLSYALGDIKTARVRYEQILEIDPTYVEALTNLGSTALSMGNKAEAETFWVRAVKVRPSYFEAVEHLVSLLCAEKRTAEAVTWIDFVENSIRRPTMKDPMWTKDSSVDSMSTDESNAAISMGSSDSDSPDMMQDVSGTGVNRNGDYFSAKGYRGSTSSSASSGVVRTSGPMYMIPPAENGRLLQLIHAKGNMLYSVGQNLQAAKAFEAAVLLGTQLSSEEGIEGLISRILEVLSIAVEEAIGMAGSGIIRNARDPLLLSPDRALRTSKLLFPPHGELPGLKHVSVGPARKAAINTTSNSLLSLAKIYQDAISAGKEVGKAASSVRDILALYYLSLALHPSPSTANNVGILLASVQQSSPLSVVYPLNNPVPPIPGLAPGSGVALALGYYYYGLQLDSRHAHLYTNLGSLLKDMGQLPAAIKMYEQAVDCDGRFDIALANLANAVKDQGHVADAIKYYKRAVNVNPDFAEAVCGLANALNSVCDWFGRGGVIGDKIDRWHVGVDGMLVDSKGKDAGGWMRKVVEIVERQLGEGREWGKGALSPVVVETLLGDAQRADGRAWTENRKSKFRAMLERWKGRSWQGARLVQMAERIAKKLVWRWYQDLYVDRVTKPLEEYRRPMLPAALSVPNAPTVLPFHTFTCPLSASQVRMISQRNGLRISCSTLKSPWLSPVVAPPPRPPAPHLNVGYVSSDFNNHPLAHLMQSVFGFHDSTKVKAYCYATSASDGSQHRQKIETEAPVFRDASSWSIEKLVKQIQEDGVHILVNLNGFTRGARNEVFAAKPAPLQMSFMGFAGTLGAEWCDYIYADETAVPRNMLRPWSRDSKFRESEEQGNVDEWDGDDYEEGEWIYAENVIYSKNTFFCTDHKQSSPDSKDGQPQWDEEEARRWKMRKTLFPDLGDDKVILGNFNQLYKIEPTTFRTWLRILMRVPNAILWLLRFPDLGEANLLRFAKLWAGEAVASRIIFTDVAAKDQHISRARVCDLFLDTPECNAHTTAADVLWSGSPLLTFPRHGYKMCSRIAASIVRSAVPDTQLGKSIAERLVVDSEEMYEDRAVELAGSVSYDAEGRCSGELAAMRKALVFNRWKSPLFDTKGWVESLEQGYWKAWEMWVRGEKGDIDL